MTEAVEPPTKQARHDADVYTAGYTEVVMAAQQRVRVFRSGNSQAVRLPKSVAYADSVRELIVHREGARLILEPAPDERFTKKFWETLGSLPDFARPRQTRRRRRLFR